MLLGKNAIIEV